MLAAGLSCAPARAEVDTEALWHPRCRSRQDGVPFAGLRLSIAILPLLAPHFGIDRNKGLVSAFFALPVAFCCSRTARPGCTSCSRRPRSTSPSSCCSARCSRSPAGFTCAARSPARRCSTRRCSPRRRARERDRHHRRVGAAVAAAAARERVARRPARRRLLHLRRVQLRRPAHAARRSAAVPRVPEGRAVRLDAAGCGRSGCA